MSRRPRAPAPLVARSASSSTTRPGDRLQSDLRPGQRLVSRDGGLWRWDGFRRVAGTPTAAAQRLRQRNRIAELDGLLAIAESDLSHCTAVLQHAQAGRRLSKEERGARRSRARGFGHARCGARPSRQGWRVRRPVLRRASPR